MTSSEVIIGVKDVLGRTEKSEKSRKEQKQ